MQGAELDRKPTGQKHVPAELREFLAFLTLQFSKPVDASEAGSEPPDRSRMSEVSTRSSLHTSEKERTDAQTSESECDRKKPTATKPAKSIGIDAGAPKKDAQPSLSPKPASSPKPARRGSKEKARRGSKDSAANAEIAKAAAASAGVSTLEDVDDEPNRGRMLLKPISRHRSPDGGTPQTPCTPCVPVDDSVNIWLRALPQTRMPYEWEDDKTAQRSFLYQGKVFDVPLLPIFELDPDVLRGSVKMSHGWQLVKSKVIGGGDVAAGKPLLMMSPGVLEQGEEA